MGEAGIRQQRFACAGFRAAQGRYESDALTVGGAEKQARAARFQYAEDARLFLTNARRICFLSSHLYNNIAVCACAAILVVRACAALSVVVGIVLLGLYICLYCI